VKYNEGAQLDASQMGGGRGRGGRIAIGGGGGLIVLVLALLFGLNPGDLLGGQTADPGSETGETPFAQCTRGSDISKDRDCRFVAFTNSIQDYWSETVQGYQVIKVNTFTGQIDTACGAASSAVGPFYCPAGTPGVYLDLAFFDQLIQQLGAQGGDAAEAYVLAHEFGHHVQNLTGTMRQVQGSGQGSGPKSPGVRLELQADCYAGVWFKHATSDPDSPITEVTQDDLNRAIDAAAAVGDDRIQEKTQGQVTPESWTHGSAAQRQKWLMRGYTTGDPNQCDTFAANAL
jgi:predicted metalloprotease